MTDSRSTLSVSVVIPAHDAATTIVEQLDAIRTQDAAWIDEVVVVDSLSSDATVATVRQVAERWPKVRVVDVARPGANTARNAGVAATTSDVILLCDADDVVAPGWAQALHDSLRDHDIVRGRYSLTLLNDADTIAARGPLASTAPPDESDAFGGLGGNCGFTRRAWLQLDGMLEHHYGSDDAEFFWRGRLEGLSVGYVDDAVVNYRLRPGMRPLFRQQMTWASGRALLYKEFADTGLVHRRSLGAAVKSWGWLAVHLPSALSRDTQRRGRWVRGAADGLGRIRGTLRHRVFFL